MGFHTHTLLHITDKSMCQENETKNNTDAFPK